MYDYNDRSRLTQYPAAVLYLHLASNCVFRPADLDRLLFVPAREPDHDWRFRVPTRGPALIRPRRIGRKAAILRILGSHQVDPRWSVADPEFAFGLALERDRGLTQRIMRTLDDPGLSDIKELEDAYGEYGEQDPIILE